MGKYQDFHNRSINQPDAFWTEQAARIDWVKPFTKVCDFSKPPFAKWFVGGETNLCYNAIDRHLATRADQPALVWISSEVEQTKTYTYREMFEEVNRFAAVLKSLGVGKGDRVLIYMPMVAEAVFAMLATVRIGAIHSVVFGGFAAASLAARIDDAKPKVMITADAGSRMGKVIPLKPLTDESIKLAQNPPKHVVIVNRGLDKSMSVIPGRDMDYSV
ncbi:MAG: AMP-binding protein, partial [Betaproteobacteria bacterium]|nr:AMP-binding protein [Betaproteobacteria bacterium]